VRPSGHREDAHGLRHSNHVIAHHHASAVFLTIGKALRRVKETFRRDSDMAEQEAISSFVVPDLLILDEIGVQ
jgi:DNA replication protein DnaC